VVRAMKVRVLKKHKKSGSYDDAEDEEAEFDYFDKYNEVTDIDYLKRFKEINTLPLLLKERVNKAVTTFYNETLDIEFMTKMFD